MGISSRVLDLLIYLRDEGYLDRHASIMEIGAQQLDNNFLSAGDKLQKLRDVFGIAQPLTLPEPKPTHIVHGGLEHLDAQAPRARDFWRWLGFEYSAIDIDGSPGSIPLDLNVDSVPADAVGKYWLVTNYGTTEHVANQLNAFKVIHDLTAVGGVMVHALPAQGMLNHGLVNYNFKFFWMLARSNGYRFVQADYYQATQSYAMPQNILDFIQGTNADHDPHLAEFKCMDGNLTVVMQKVFDIAYVPPIDVDTGTKTDIPALKQRYWTVFDPDTFARIQAEQMARKDNP